MYLRDIFVTNIIFTWGMKKKNILRNVHVLSEGCISLFLRNVSSSDECVYLMNLSTCGCVLTTWGIYFFLGNVHDTCCMYHVSLKNLYVPLRNVFIQGEGLYMLLGKVFTWGMDPCQRKVFTWGIYVCQRNVFTWGMYSLVGKVLTTGTCLLLGKVGIYLRTVSVRNVVTSTAGKG